jgi:general secretion pathway protein L
MITGGGALLGDMARWLSAELTLPVEPLNLDLDGLENRPDAHRFARAIGIAFTATPRRRGLDLRRGPLAFERGFGWIRDRAPLLAGLGATILVAWIFASWARLRTLDADQKALTAALAQTSEEVLGESTGDVERVGDLLSKKSGAGGDDDPMPRADAMDVLVQISELIPTDKMKHDIEKLEMQKASSGGFRVQISGVAPTVSDVTNIESLLKNYRCFQNPTVTKKTKAIADDRQKYTLEIELRCPEEGGGAAKKTTGSGASPAGSK